VGVGRKARGIYEAVERSAEAPIGRVRPEVERRVAEFIGEIERQLGEGPGDGFEASRVSEAHEGSKADAA
jgi:hypothetical protein